jgi:hypothetical protein
MQFVPDHRSNKAKDVSDNYRHSDEGNRRQRIERFDDVNRLDHVRPEDEVDDALRPTEQDEYRPNQMPAADQYADYEAYLVRISYVFRQLRFCASLIAIVDLGSSCRSFAGREMFAKLGGRLAEDSLEGAIELGERLEPDVVSNLADPPIRIQQPVPGIFQAHACDIVGELKSRALVKNFAKMKHACARRFGDIGQR